MRLVVGISLIANGIENLQAGQPLGMTLLYILTIGAGALLAVGLWTPVAGFLASALATWTVMTEHASLCPAVLSAAVGAGLALLGPGAWSFDAWLFGWKQIDFKD